MDRDNEANIYRRKRIRVVVDLVVTNELDYLDDMPRDVSFEEVKDGIIVQDSNVIDGYELTTDIPGFSNDDHFFIDGATIVSKEFID